MAHPAPGLSLPSAPLEASGAVGGVRGDPTCRKEGGCAQGRFLSTPEGACPRTSSTADLTVILTVRFILFVCLQSWVLQTEEMTQDQTYIALNLKALN